MGFLFHPLWEGEMGCQASSAQSRARQHSQLQWEGGAHCLETQRTGGSRPPRSRNPLGHLPPQRRSVIPGTGSIGEGGEAAALLLEVGNGSPPPELFNPRLRAGGASAQEASSPPSLLQPSHSELLSITSCVPRRLTHSRAPSGLFIPTLGSAFLKGS